MVLHETMCNISAKDCHLTPLTHLSHPPNSPLSHLSQLTSLPTTSRHLYSNVFLLGRQGKHVWLIVRQPLMKAGWWEAPLALRDLAEAIRLPLKSTFWSQIFQENLLLPSRIKCTTWKARLTLTIRWLDISSWYYCCP